MFQGVEALAELAKLGRRVLGCASLCAKLGVLSLERLQASMELLECLSLSPGPSFAESVIGVSSMRG